MIVSRDLPSRGEAYTPWESTQTLKVYKAIQDAIQYLLKCDNVSTKYVTLALSGQVGNNEIKRDVLTWEKGVTYKFSKVLRNLPWGKPKSGLGSVLALCIASVVGHVQSARAYSNADVTFAKNGSVVISFFGLHGDDEKDVWRMQLLIEVPTEVPFISKITCNSWVVGAWQGFRQQSLGGGMVSFDTPEDGECQEYPPNGAKPDPLDALRDGLLVETKEGMRTVGLFLQDLVKEVKEKLVYPDCSQISVTFKTWKNLPNFRLGEVDIPFLNLFPRAGQGFNVWNFAVNQKKELQGKDLENELVMGNYFLMKLSDMFRTEFCHEFDSTIFKHSVAEQIQICFPVISQGQEAMCVDVFLGKEEGGSNNVLVIRTKPEGPLDELLKKGYVFWEELKMKYQLTLIDKDGRPMQKREDVVQAIGKDADCYDTGVEETNGEPARKQKKRPQEKTADVGNKQKKARKAQSGVGKGGEDPKETTNPSDVSAGTVGSPTEDAGPNIRNTRSSTKRQHEAENGHVSEACDAKQEKKANQPQSNVGKGGGDPKETRKKSNVSADGVASQTEVASQEEVGSQTEDASSSGGQEAVDASDARVQSLRGCLQECANLLVNQLSPDGQAAFSFCAKHLTQLIDEADKK